MLQDYQKLMTMLQEERQSIWLFAGDSITHGALHTNGWRSYVEHFQERLRWELSHFHDYVINTGISGYKTDNLMQTFEESVSRFSPDVVFVMLGMNDCTWGSSGRSKFMENMRRIIEQIRDIGAIPVIQTPNTINVADHPARIELPAYVDVIREEASARQAVLIDHYAHWESQTKSNDGVMLGWLNDAIHPNERGHMELARKIFMDLHIFDPASPTCSITSPC